MTPMPQTTPPTDEMQDLDREFWLRIREARLIEIAAIEKRLGLERSQETRKDRKDRKRFGVSRI